MSANSFFIKSFFRLNFFFDLKKLFSLHGVDEAVFGRLLVTPVLSVGRVSQVKRPSEDGDVPRTNVSPPGRIVADGVRQRLSEGHQTPLPLPSVLPTGESN